MSGQPLSAPLLMTLAEAARTVMTAANPADKVTLTRRFTDAWRAGTITDPGTANLPDRPARPDRPQLLAPRDMPKRKLGGEAGRAAFVHAIAHIELNAIDLAWDITARFTGEDMPPAFYDDWTQVARDEAEHFDMLNRRLLDLGSAYGAMPAHDGLWQAAEETRDDLLARLALVPMVLEARGLDTAPDAVKRLQSAGDEATAAILARIGDEEIPHVAAGVRWFEFLCARRGLEPAATFQSLVRTRFQGRIKGPFNHAARDRANFPERYYLPLAA
ncbi:MAG: ferritin-like domain-containing protein [Rhodospirillales bacterium]